MAEQNALFGPAWLTEDFLAQCLRIEKADEGIVVTRFQLSEAAPPGNNYGTYITRVKVEYTDGHLQRRTVSLIMKAELTDGPMSEVLTDVSHNEPIFYYKFVPVARRFSSLDFVAKTFVSPSPTVTILEDLCEKGFRMQDRQRQLDFEHCCLYVKAAAELHAVSVPVYNSTPGLLESIEGANAFVNDSPMTNSLKAFLKYGTICLVDALEAEGYRRQCDILRKLQPHLWEFVVEANIAPNVIVKTIRQGDPWTANMMFRYNEQGEVCDIKIIDFQATTYGSPINDLVYFIWTSANNEVKRNRLDQLYTIYTAAFNAKMKSFDVKDRLTVEQVRAEVLRLSPMVIFAVIINPPLLSPDPMDLEAIFAVNIDVPRAMNTFKKSYTEEFYRNYLPGLMDCLDHNMVFTYLESKMDHSLRKIKDVDGANGNEEENGNDEENGENGSGENGRNGNNGEDEDDDSTSVDISEPSEQSRAQ